MTLYSDILAYYEFEGSMDDTPGTADLTQVGTPTYVAGKIGDAVNLVAASTQYGHSSDAIFNRGDTSWEWDGWVMTHSLPGSGGTHVVLSKDDFGVDRAYLVGLVEGTPDVFFLNVYDGGSTLIGGIGAGTFGQPSINTWYFLSFGHDAVNNQVFIAVDAGTEDVSATTGAAGDSASRFELGSILGLSAPFAWNGKIDELGLYLGKRNQAEREFLYNNGAGRGLGAIITWSNQAPYLGRPYGRSGARQMQQLLAR